MLSSKYLQSSSTFSKNGKIHKVNSFFNVSFILFSGGSSLASVVAGSKPTRLLNKPDFDDIGPRNVTAIVGQTAELNCFVKHPGDRVVSDDLFFKIYFEANINANR